MPRSARVTIRNPSLKPLPIADLFCPEFQQDPYPTYAKLRKQAPVYWSEQIQAWVVTRYEDVLTCLHDPRISANRILPRMQQMPETLRVQLAPLERTLSMWPLMLERPNHTRLRQLINKAMTPRIVRNFIPVIQGQVDELLDSALASDSVDFISDIATPYPLNVVSEIIGAPVEGRPLLKACAVDIVNFFGSPPHEYEVRAKTAMRSISEATQMLRDILLMRRKQPAADLISSLVEAEERGDVMSEEEILATCLMMVFAGFETTTNLIGNGLLLLLQHPHIEAQLRNNPDLMRGAIGEMLRHESPVQRLSRMAVDDFTLQNEHIKRGDLIFLMAASANRDDQKFPDPDQFNIERDTKNHLAFGHSIHLCPGNTLAQLETQILFTELFKRTRSIKLVESRPDWQINLSVRSLTRLPIKLEPLEKPLIINPTSIVHHETYETVTNA